MAIHHKRCAVGLTVTGLVQGIGYRPFVRREALSRSICGSVQNSGGGVVIYACGEKKALDSFVRCLRNSPPKGTLYASFELCDAQWMEIEGFTIIESDRRHLLPIVSPDLAPCAECERELFAPDDRRYRHPFISCANCGPRFSLQSALPYDRVRTSMASFEICADCAAEYHAIDTRRSFAQTIACPSCGPQLVYSCDRQTLQGNDALDACIAHLKSGGIDAIKNIGGFHLACRADDETAVNILRTVKGREEKPFALLFADLDAIRAVAQVNDAETRLLTSPARPIVLLRRKGKGRIARSVCRDSLYIGAMLPSSPLQHLLVRAVGCLVMTSANRSGEPLCSEGIALADWLPSSIGVLDNNRPIMAPQDDSICFVANLSGISKPLFLRRARGYAPLPIDLPMADDMPTLAAGGDLKAVFALAHRQVAYLSPYIGDLEDLPTADRYLAMLDHMSALLDIKPRKVVCDLHPSYHSAKMAQKWIKSNEMGERLSPDIIKVRHHHAHIASVMAEHRLTEVIGFAFDGTGYGSDQTIWGGELLYCKGSSYERLLCLKPLPLLGGDSAAVDCYRTAATFLLASGKVPWDDDSRLWSAALKAGVGSILTSSMGRLFDAAASILGVCHSNAYEGQAATMLEACAVLWQADSGVPAELALTAEDDRWRSDTLLIELSEQKDQGVPIGALALGFHLAIADAVADAAMKYSRIFGCNDIALSGGVFANRLLLSACHERLTARGFSVYINEKLPAGDGNIALGQAYIASLGDA